MKNGTLRLDVLNNGSIKDLTNVVLTGSTFTGGQVYTVQKILTAVSQFANDGWVLETGENTNIGGLLNSISPTLILGDNDAKRQYRDVLSFATADIPDSAVITKATLVLTKQSIVGGGNPVSIFNGFMVDAKVGYIGSVITLQPLDFQVSTTKTASPKIVTPVGNVYKLDLSTLTTSINKLVTNGGLTQMRVRFALDDNNNSVANYIIFYSGNSTTAAFCPQLILEYYVP